MKIISLQTTMISCKKNQVGTDKEFGSQHVCKNEGIEMPINQVILLEKKSDQMKSDKIDNKQSETIKSKKGLVMHKGISRQGTSSSNKKKKGLGIKFNFIGKGSKKK